MYTTRPLSVIQNSSEAMRLLLEGPNSGYLVIQDEEPEQTKSSYIVNLPFPQNKLLSIYHGGSGPFPPLVDDVYLIPIINKPLSSNQYYAIKADGYQRGEAYTSSNFKGRCFCLTNITDVCPRPFDIDDIYQQFEFFKTDCCIPVAESLAPDAYPPKLLGTLGSQMKSKSTKIFYIGEARGIDSSLRANLPDFNFLPSQENSKSVVVGKWYCPFMFIKDGRRKDQVKENVFYKMTLEQRWEQIFAAERSYSQEKKVKVDVVVPTETVKISGQEAVQEKRNNDRGVVWFKSTDESGMEVFVGLSTLIVERMRWEQEKVGWIKDKEQHIRVVKDQIYEGIGDWKSFSCYVLVESFVLKRNNGRILLTYDFRHTHQTRSNWD